MSGFSGPREPADFVHPESFGALGDGSDETSKLMAMADEARQQGVLNCILKSGKTYGYKKPGFLANIKTIRIIGNGASFINLNGSATDTTFASNNEGLVFQAPWSTNGAEHYAGSLTPYNEGQLIETAAAGASTITVKVADGVPEVAAGNNILLYGFDRQNNASFPPCCLVFEYATVASVSGQNVTLSGPLKNKLNADWDENLFGGVPYGAPRIINLTRANFVETESFYVENLTIKRNPAWTAPLGTAERNGRLTLGGMRNAHLVNVEVEGGAYVSAVQKLLWDGGRVHASLVPDKIITEVELVNLRMDKLSEGLGTQITRCKNCRIDTAIALNATDRIVYEDCDLPLNDLTSSGGFGSGQGFVPELVISGGRIRVPDVGRQHIFFPSDETFAFTVVDANTLSVPLASYVAALMGRYIRVGTVLTNDGVPAFEVSDLPYRSGSDVLIKGFTLNSFISGTSLGYPTRLGKLTLDNPSIESAFEQKIRPVTRSPMADPVYFKFIGLGYTESSFEVTSEQLAVGLNENSGSCFGALGGLWRPERMMVDVHKAYTGTDPAPKITFREYNRHGNTYMTIDALTTGLRWVGINGNSPALGTDVLPAFNTSLMEGWRVSPAPAYTQIDAAKAPRFTFRIEGTRLRGGLG